MQLQHVKRTGLDMGSGLGGRKPTTHHTLANRNHANSDRSFRNTLGGQNEIVCTSLLGRLLTHGHHVVKECERVARFLAPEGAVRYLLDSRCLDSLKKSGNISVRIW